MNRRCDPRRLAFTNQLGRVLQGTKNSPNLFGGTALAAMRVLLYCAQLGNLEGDLYHYRSGSSRKLGVAVAWHLSRCRPSRNLWTWFHCADLTRRAPVIPK